MPERALLLVLVARNFRKPTTFSHVSTECTTHSRPCTNAATHAFCPIYTAMSGAAAVAHGAPLNPRQRQMRLHLGQLQTIRHAARYTYDTYLEESKPLHAQLMNSPYVALYLAYHWLSWTVAAAALVLAAAAYAGIYAFFSAAAVTTILASATPRLVAGFRWATGTPPDAAANNAADLTLLAYVTTMQRHRLCLRMHREWRALFRASDAVFQRWREANRDGDSAAAQGLDPAADVRVLQKMYDAVYDQQQHTSNVAYAIVDKELDSWWLPNDKACSHLEFGTPA